MGIRSVGVPFDGDPAPQDHQQAQLLSILRRRVGEPVTFGELQAAGIEFPASVVAELELGGYELERLQSGVRLPSYAAPLPEPERVAIATKSRVTRGPRLRARLLAPLALLAGAAAIAAVIVAASSGGTAQPRLSAQSRPAARPHPSPRAIADTAVQPRASLAHPVSHARAVQRVRTTSQVPAVVAPAAPSPAPATPVRSPATPVRSPAATVQQFYEAAAQHQYGAAWALADANMRAQLQGYSAFANEMSSVRSISFHRAQTVADEGSSSATVDVATTSVQNDTTQQCSGAVRTVRAGDAWLLDGISISCS